MIFALRSLRYLDLNIIFFLALLVFSILSRSMHGTVEWLPGQPLGNDRKSWSDDLLDGLPNIYVYAANNPSGKAKDTTKYSAHLTVDLTCTILNINYRYFLESKQKAF
jgi:CobN/Magnesium Chelatase